MVDSLLLSSSAPQDYVLDVRREGPFPFVLEPDYLQQGADTTVTAFDLGGDGWTQGDVIFDFGDGVTVLEVTVAGGGDEAEISLSVATDATIGPRDVEVTTGAGSATTTAALEVGTFLYSTSCADADAMAPLEPGRYLGSTAFSGLGEATGEPCLVASDGYETIVPIDVPPGWTLEVVVEADFDVVLYLVSSCLDAPLACSDHDAAGGPEHLSWAAPAAGGAAYLVVDGAGLDDSGDFELLLEVHP